MRKAIAATAILFAASIATSNIAAAADTSATEKQLIAMEAAWSKAYTQKDTATIAAMMAEDWVGQSESGKPENKAALLAMVKSGTSTAATMVNRDVKARVFGDVAIVQGSDDEKSMFKGKDTSGAYTWMDVFVKRDGKWVVVASQVTKVTAK